MEQTDSRTKVISPTEGGPLADGNGPCGDRRVMISARDIRKTFRVPNDPRRSMKAAAINLFRRQTYTDYHVLEGVSFDVCEGEFFGIVGRNGSGKSTLLKILAGIYLPDSGTIEVNGKISPFLELGVGFNPELTGTENVFLNGAILGLSKSEIQEKYQEIVEFAELEQFMGQKLKNYSSGMQVRLAFSVSIHAHAPIILLDEVLAVGDARFQDKSAAVFKDLKAQGRTIVFVSHSMNSVRRFCDRVMLIHRGEVAMIGAPDDVTEAYLELNA